MFPANIETFVDVFAGSAIVSMNVKAERYIVNDKDSHLQDLYQIFTYNTADEIISRVESIIDEYNLPKERTKCNTYNDKGKIEEYKRAYVNLRNHYNESGDLLEFYTLMLYSFSQQFRFNKKGKFNMPFGNDCFCDKNKEYIHNGQKFFGNLKCHIMEEDFRTILTSFQKTSAFYYCDPPYFGTDSVYNERHSGWTIEDEVDLLSMLDMVNNRGQKFALSNVLFNKGKENKVLAEWINAKGYRVHHFSNFSYTACGKGNANTDEVLVVNY